MNRVSGSTKTGMVGGLFLVTGLVLGLALSAKMDWLTPGAGDQRRETSPLASPESPEVATAVSPGQPFIGIVEATTPAVVNIATTRLIQGPQGGPQSPFFDDPFFRRFFGDEFFRRFEMPRERREQSLGSGVIVDPSGYIITNNHVVAHADEIKVLLEDKRELNGRLVGSDPKTDIAVIKVEAEHLPLISWGDSNLLRVGEYVLAIGNPFGLNQTVTMGIISAVGRAQVGIADYEDFIQTDAAINPGNSGGALINIHGELIGINTAIFSRNGGYMGIGFAVPSNMARSVMNSLIESGKVIRGWLGVSIQDINPDLAAEFGLKDAKGALIGDIMKGSPADRGKLKPGDVIVEFDGTRIESASHLRNLVAQSPVGKQVTVEIIRDKGPVTMTVKIGDMPLEMAGDSFSLTESEKGAALAGLEVTNLNRELARRFAIPESERGVLISSVGPGSPGAAAGLQVGDLIIKVNHTSVPDLNEFRNVTKKINESETVLLLVSREGRKMFVVIKP